MNTRAFLKSLAFGAPLIFVPQLIKPVWKRYVSTSEEDCNRFFDYLYDNYPKIKAEIDASMLAEYLECLPEPTWIGSVKTASWDDYCRDIEASEPAVACKWEKFA